MPARRCRCSSPAARAPGSIDVDGNVHIDYVLGNGPAILGHAPKPVIEAVARSLGDGQVYAGQHPRETELAERLCRLLPGAEVVRFATSGTEAVLMAMRLARAFTGRTKILKFEGHYHGWSDQAYISARPSLNEAGPAESPVPVAGSPGMPKACSTMSWSRAGTISTPLSPPSIVIPARSPPSSWNRSW